ncbi:MAG TPA: lamin tail domain-containing protein [Verrucomicrobiae bacterium]
MEAWRQNGFDDATWSAAATPVFYSTSVTEPPFYNGGVAEGTENSGMMDSYSSLFLRKNFAVTSAISISELHLDTACDDGFIAWINGEEVVRYNVSAGSLGFDDLAANSVDEPAALQRHVIRNPTMLVNGSNVIAVQVFNAALNSSDIGFMAGLTAPVDDVAPSVAAISPPNGATLGELTQIEITFSEIVSGVDASDLLINGSAATNITGSGFGPYVFTFPAAPNGVVTIAWAPGNGIRDGSANQFGGGTWSYRIDPSFIVPLARITEFMASNSKTLADEDGEFSDWVEIHNPRQTSLDLANWCLTDDSRLLTKWRFPATNLPPGGRIVVFASGKDRAVSGAELHTRFSLNADAEYLGLVRPDGVTIVSEFRPTFPEQNPDLSYGAIEDVGGNAYLFAPTPGVRNTPAIGAERVVDTKFLPTRGLFDQPVEVTISCATPGVTIRYTLDGSVPTATHGGIYGGPIAITRSQAVRAAAFKSGAVPSNVDTHTYILPDAVMDQSPNNEAPPGWPSGPVNGQRYDYGMDRRIVNNSNTNIGGRPQVLAALKALPSMSIVLPQQDFSSAATGLYSNPQQRGREWERAASVELVNDSTNSFQVEAGLRIRGNFSRDGNNPKHSFRLLFRSEYGDSLLRYPLYGPEGADEFNAIDVQTPQDFSWAYYDPAMCNYMRDTWSRDTQGDMGQPYARSRWVQLYINGIYWGIYQVEERPEAKFAANYLGGDNDDYDVIKNTGFAEDFHIEAADGFLTGPPGQPTAWERLFSACRAHFESANEATYFALQGLLPDGVTRTSAPDAVLLDPDNLADWLLMVMYSANHDMGSSVWVGQKPNNFWGMRRRGGERGFVWVAHDGETSMDYYPVNYDRTGPVNGTIRDEFQWSNPEFFHNDLLPSLEWRTKFGDRAQRALFNGGALTPEASIARLNQREAELQLAIVAESARWGDAQSPNDPYTKTDWLRKLADTREWLSARREYLVAQLRADGLYPNVAAPTLSKLGGEFNSGEGMTMSAPAGTIYYTLDGGDPRLPGGALSSEAIAYSGGVTLTRSARLRARTRLGNEWSALVEVSFYRRQDWSALRITELMYHPPALGTNDGSQFEFIELKNVGATDIDLGGVVIEGASHTITNGTILPGGGFMVFVHDAAAFATKYSTVPVGGVFAGSLDNDGEKIALVRPGDGAEIFAVDFGTRPPWPVIADGWGFSIVPAGQGESLEWRASSTIGGSPGTDDPAQVGSPEIVLAPSDQTVAVNESFVLSVGVQAGSPPYTYVWYSGSSAVRTNVTFATNDYARLNTSENPGDRFYTVQVGNASEPNASGSLASAYVQFVRDSDIDGMTDNWETNYVFLPSDPADANLDFDFDGLSNVQEYRAGTNPTNAASALRLELVVTSGTAALNFEAAPARTYSLQAADSLAPASWERVADFPATTAPRAVNYATPAAINRYYRVVTPRMQ